MAIGLPSVSTSSTLGGSYGTALPAHTAHLSDDDAGAGRRADREAAGVDLFDAGRLVRLGTASRSSLLLKSIETRGDESSHRDSIESSRPLNASSRSAPRSSGKRSGRRAPSRSRVASRRRRRRSRRGSRCGSGSGVSRASACAGSQRLDSRAARRARRAGRPPPPDTAPARCFRDRRVGRCDSVRSPSRLRTRTPRAPGKASASPVTEFDRDPVLAEQAVAGIAERPRQGRLAALGRSAEEHGPAAHLDRRGVQDEVAAQREQRADRRGDDPVLDAARRRSSRLSTTIRPDAGLEQEARRRRQLEQAAPPPRARRWRTSSARRRRPARSTGSRWRRDERLRRRLDPSAPPRPRRRR